MEQEILRLLADLDIGKASFLLLAVIVLWGMRNIVASLLRIEKYIGKAADHTERTAYFMNEMLAIFEREGFPFRKDQKEATKSK